MINMGKRYIMDDYSHEWDRERLCIPGSASGRGIAQVAWYTAAGADRTGRYFIVATQGRKRRVQ